MFTITYVETNFYYPFSRLIEYHDEVCIAKFRSKHFEEVEAYVIVSIKDLKVFALIKFKFCHGKIRDASYYRS